MTLDSGDDSLGKAREVAESVASSSLLLVLDAVNPGLGVLAAGFSTAWSNGLLSQWLKVLGERTAASSTFPDPDDPRTRAAFQRLTIGALQTSRTEKWQLLADALLHSGPLSAESDFMVEHFADLVVRLSPEHVRVLQVLACPSAFNLDVPRLSDEALLAALMPSLDGDDKTEARMMVDIVKSDLTFSDLIETNFVTTYERAKSGDLEAGFSDATVTAKGIRFLAHLGLSSGAAR